MMHMFYEQKLNAATETKEYNIYKRKSQKQTQSIQKGLLKWVCRKAVTKSVLPSLMPREGIVF